jgi:hypothetical protein
MIYSFQDSRIQKRRSTKMKSNPILKGIFCYASLIDF